MSGFAKSSPVVFTPFAPDPAFSWISNRLFPDPRSSEKPQAVFHNVQPEAATAFMKAVDRLSLKAGSWPHPLTGPDGDGLATATAWVGPEDASHILVLLSGTHGVEGFAGSAIQLDLLNAMEDQDKDPADLLPPDCALLFIHAINPWAWAWLRRVDEQGIDLNRNFVDFSAPLPENHVYSGYADIIVPADLSPERQVEATLRLRDAEARLGRDALEDGLTRGQHSHPDGLFYGGEEPSWSRQTIDAILQIFNLRERKTVMVLDLHTGLGPFGHAELICDHAPDSLAASRARQWFGAFVGEPALGQSVSGEKTGLMDFGWQQALGESCLYLTFEIGTWSVEQELQALAAEHVIHKPGQFPDMHDPAVLAVKTALKNFFYPESFAWRQLLILRGRQTVWQALTGLASLATDASQ